MDNADAAARFRLLRDILDLTRAQQSALEEASIDRFEQLLGERAVLIDQLSVLTGEADAADALPPNVIAFPGRERGTGEDDLALDTVLSGILYHDRRNQQLLEAMLEEIRRELPTVGAGQQAANGYRLRQETPRFIDRVS